MKKVFTSLLVVLAFCTAIIAAVQTELRLRVFQEGDKGETYLVVQKIDSMKFSYDTLEYKVSFVDWDGTVLQSGILQSGSMPEYKGGENPTREQTAKCTYVFKGWTPAIEEVQSEATYTAVYDSTIHQYGVVFLDLDGEVLSTEFLDYGTMPSYSGELPTKESTKLYDYVIAWKPKLAEVTCNISYKAYFDSTKHEYTCIFNDYDGTELFRTDSGTYDYVPEKKPTRSSSSGYNYKFKSWSLDESQITSNILIYTAVYDTIFNTRLNGALTQASYKVSDSTSVYFSQGNLQFTTQGSHKTADSTAKGTWRFAENQYDYIGSANKNISETYDGWIDLFGWGTSGWSSGANAYQPWATSTSYSDYYPGGDESNNLTGDFANADWGVYNAISNGGNEPNKWRTLTTSEWQYLFQNNMWTLGYIMDSTNSCLCFMLIPETFAAPEGTTMTALSTTTSSTYLTNLTVPSTNKYTTEQFASLEKSGVVALPCGGFRSGTSMYDFGSNGDYWSSSELYSYFAYGFYFSSNHVSSNNSSNRDSGCSVRLVQDVQ